MSRAQTIAGAPLSRADTGAAAGAGHRAATFDVWVVLAFLYPLTQVVVFDLVGSLYLMDLLAVPLVASLLLMPDARERLMRIWPLLALLAAWMGGQIVTDLIRATAPQDFLRGWAKIAFFSLHVVALWLWLPRRRSYLAAFAVGMGIAAALTVPEQFQGYEWKFGYDRAAAYVALGLFAFIGRLFPSARYLVPPILLALAALLLLQAARSAFGIALLSAIVIACALALDRQGIVRKAVERKLLIALVLVGLATTFAATTFYASAVEKGALGREAIVKYRDQATSDLPIIVGGRSEVLVSIRAIGDSPIIGHGSWAKDPAYLDLLYATKVRLGLPVFDPQRGERRLIPSHSYLFGAWVEAGIAGGLVWIWILGLPVLALAGILKRRDPLMPLVVYCSIALTWAVLFNPFGAQERFIVAFQIVLLMWFVKAGRSSLRWLGDGEGGWRRRRDGSTH